MHIRETVGAGESTSAWRGDHPTDRYQIIHSANAYDGNNLFSFECPHSIDVIIMNPDRRIVGEHNAIPMAIGSIHVL